jgi:hypothetical protein
VEESSKKGHNHFPVERLDVGMEYAILLKEALEHVHRIVVKNLVFYK